MTDARCPRRLPSVYPAGFLAGCLLFAATARAQEPAAPPEPQPIVATDLFEIRQLGDVAVSPDGRMVVYTVRTIVPEVEHEGAYAYETHLYLASADGREAPRRLTFGESATQPAWHPDGDRLAFVRRVDGKPQVFVLPLSGGEAYPLTSFHHGASGPRWSPDGTKLLFTATLTEADVRAAMGTAPRWPSERPGRTPADTAGARPDPDGTLAQVRAWLDSNAAQESPRVFNRLDLQGETDLEPAPSFDHLYVLELEAEGAAPRPLTRGYYSFADPVWTPDGARVVFSGAVGLDRHPDRVRDRDLFVVNADGTGFQPLLDLEGYALSDPAVSPQGRLVAFRATPLDDPGYGQAELGVVGLLERSAPRLLTLDFDRSPGPPRWADDGWFLYFTAPSDGGFPLYRLRVYETEAEAQAEEAPVDEAVPDTLAADAPAADSLAAPDTLAGAPDVPESPIERLTGFDRGVRSFDLGRATVFYVLTEAANPFELYAANLEFTRERRLTSHNAAWLAGRRLSTPEAFTLVRDTLTIPYWVMKPAGYEEGRTYPLLVQIHGGPSAMWGPGEATMWFEFQFFAARGYGVVYANPRGSGGYGYAFQRANYRDWAEGPAGDVLAVATEAARLPWVDPDRQVVTGGSYAGYLTAWIVAHDNRFRAAVAQRGVYDLAVFLGEGNAWRLVPGHFGGFPWDPDLPLPAALPTPEPTALPAPDTTFADTVLADTVLADTVFADTVFADTALAPEAAPDTTALSEVAAALLAVVAADSTGAAPADTAFADTALVAADTLAVPGDTAAVAVSPGGVLAVAGEGPWPEEGAVAAPSLREFLARSSPITYAHQIRTPLLILHGDNDLRTGPAQSEVLYKTLKILDRPVEYVRYPGAGHELSRSGDPKHRLDRILRIYEFFERFL